MADTVIAASLNLEAGQAVKSVQDFKNELKQAEKDYTILKDTVGETNAATLKAAENISKIKDQLNLASDSAKGFKTKVREAEENLISIQQKFGATSKEALAAAKGVANMRDQMQEAKEVSDLFDPGAKFQVFGNVLRTVAGGFSALTGTMALFGADSKEVEKQILKVQAALAITEGINTIADSAKDFQRFKAMIAQTTVVQKTFTASTVASNAILKVLGVTTTATSIGFKVLRATMIATGIGALVAAVGYLIVNFKDLKQSLYNLVPQLELYGKYIGYIVQSMTDFAGLTSKAERSTDRLADVTKKLNERYEQQIKILTAQGGKEKEIAELRQKIATNDLRILERKKQVNKELTEEEFKQSQDLATEKKVIALEEQQRANKIEDDAKKKRAEDAKRNSEESKRRQEEAKKKREERLKELQQELEDAKKFRADMQALAEDALVKINELDAQEVQGKKDLFNQRIENTRAAFSNEANLMSELRYIQMDEIQQQESDELFRLGEWYASRYELVKGNADAEQALLSQSESMKAKIERDSFHLRLAIVGNLLGQMSDLFGKHTVAGKVTAIAEATINTYLAATKALTGIPKGNPIGAAMAITQAAIVIGVGLKNVREIAKVKVPSIGGGASAMPNISADAPLIPQVQQTSTRLDQQSINDMGNAAAGGVNRPVRAYVVQSDSQAEADRAARLANAAKLGN